MSRGGLVAILLCIAVRPAMPQTISDMGANTRVLALEYTWNQAEENKDTRALDGILDNAMVFVDHDGSLRTKAEFLARVKSEQSHPQQQVTKTMTAHVFGSVAVVTGVYVAKGIEKGKPYIHHRRFADTWISKNGSWVCVASLATPISQ
jgi:ketosteroid isomerase-like protein